MRAITTETLGAGDRIPNPYSPNEDWLVVSRTGNECVIRWPDGSETIGSVLPEGRTDQTAIQSSLDLLRYDHISARFS